MVRMLGEVGKKYGRIMENVWKYGRSMEGV